MGADFHLDRDPQTKKGSFTSPVIKFDAPMNRAILSWNAVTPGNSHVELFIRARVGGLDWSNWFSMGEWGSNIEAHSIKGQDNKFGKVDIDTLELKGTATD